MATFVNSLPKSAVCVSVCFDGFFKQYETSKYRYICFDGLIQRYPIRK